MKRLILAALWVVTSFSLLTWILYGHSEYLVAIQGATDSDVGEAPSFDRIKALEQKLSDLIAKRLRAEYNDMIAKKLPTESERQSEARPGDALESLYAAISKSRDEINRYRRLWSVYALRHDFLRRIWISWAVLTFLPLIALFGWPLARKVKEALHEPKTSSSDDKQPPT